MDYNEIVVSGAHLNAHLPQAVEAFFGGAKAREQRRRFVEHYRLEGEAVPPLLTFDRNNWHAPFQEAAS